MEAIAWLKLLVAVIFIVLLIRIAYVLSSTPVGELAQELLYVRMSELRTPGYLVLVALVLEMGRFAYPVVVRYLGFLTFYPDFAAYFDAAEAVLLGIAVVQVYLLVRAYTTRGVEDHARDTLDEIATLQGQRTLRRRSRSEEE